MHQLQKYDCIGYVYSWQELLIIRIPVEILREPELIFLQKKTLECRVGGRESQFAANMEWWVI